MFSSVAFGVMEQVYTPIFVAWCYRNWQMCIYIDIIGVARSAVWGGAFLPAVSDVLAWWW